MRARSSDVMPPPYTAVAVSKVCRIHSEIVWLLAFALAAIALKVSCVKRTGTILPLASPFGSLGRPTFLAFFCCSTVLELLYDSRPNCVAG